ncbi:MAG: hypothetical protein DRO23_03455 [Thermoprotei archaeon]|nr:MAG: hypothetical protein DRO23_03455 [Thermoprotei archaeon]
MSRFCAKCGKVEDSSIPFIGNLCAKCFLEEYSVLEIPKEITLHLCSRCLSYKFKGKWFPPKSYMLKNVVFEVLEKELSQKIRLTVKELDVYYSLTLPEKIGPRFTLTLKALVKAGKYSTVQEQNIIVNISYELCPNCSMKISGTYKALVQVRSAKTYLSHRERILISKVLKEIGERNIVEIVELKEGLDIKTTDITTARKIALKIKHKTGATIRETHEDIRRTREGKRTSKLIITVRLPEFLENDIIIFENEVYRIVNVSNTYVTLVNERSGEKRTLPVGVLWERKFKKLTNEYPSAKLIVIGISDTKVYTVRVDKEYEMYEIPVAKIPYTVRVGEELKAIIINGKPYVLGKI